MYIFSKSTKTVEIRFLNHHSVEETVVLDKSLVNDFLNNDFIYPQSVNPLKP